MNFLTVARTLNDTYSSAPNRKDPVIDGNGLSSPLNPIEDLPSFKAGNIQVNVHFYLRSSDL